MVPVHTTIPFSSGKFLWSERCFENNPWAETNIQRDEIWNSISCHLAFFSLNFAEGQIEELDWITFSIWHKIYLRSDFSWSFRVKSVVDNPVFALKLRFPVLFSDVVTLWQSGPQISRVNLVWRVPDYNILLREFWLLLVIELQRRLPPSLSSPHNLQTAVEEI